jgi:hypothetical protein
VLVYESGVLDAAGLASGTQFGAVDVTAAKVVNQASLVGRADVVRVREATAAAAAGSSGGGATGRRRKEGSSGRVYKQVSALSTAVG